MELSPKQQMEQLTATLLRYNDEYYNQDNPSVPDDVYDKLMAQLRELEAQYPEYAAPDSPSGGQRFCHLHQGTAHRPNGFFAGRVFPG